jgi:hypothetical protein
VSIRVTGVPNPAISAGYEPLYALRASLRATDVSAGYGRLCGRRASLRATGVSAGDGRLCGLRTSLRATDVSARDELLYAWLASLSTDYSCGSASTATLTRASTGGWPRSLYGLQLRICQYRKSGARLPPCSLWSVLVYHAACHVCNALCCSAYSANNRVIQQNSPAN